MLDASVWPADDLDLELDPGRRGSRESVNEML